MRNRLMHWLVCPRCSGKLQVLTSKVSRAPIDDADFHVLDQIARIAHQDEVENEIITGALTCDMCKVYYPIYNGVPRMLTYETDVAHVHRRENASWIDEHLSGLTLPKWPSPPGEKDVSRNFSTEWTNYKWSGESYWSGTPEAVLDWMRFSLGTDRHSLKGKLALEVGIGIGGIADGLARSEKCEIVGVDLSYSVDQARRHFRHNPLLHIVQASVFALPFKSRTFDVVYSQGVIHHTHSAQEAFRHLTSMPKENGMLYVWVYSHDDESASLLRRTLMAVERTIRPLISRLPTPVQTMALVPTVIPYIVYQNVIRRGRLGRETTAAYGWSEAMHAARDRLTPRFASRHTYEEVAKWFQVESYGDLELLRDEPLPAGFPKSLQRCIGIRGFLQGGSTHTKAPTQTKQERGPEAGRGLV